MTQSEYIEKVMREIKQLNIDACNCVHCVDVLYGKIRSAIRGAYNLGNHDKFVEKEKI